MRNVDNKNTPTRNIQNRTFKIDGVEPIVYDKSTGNISINGLTSLGTAHQIIQTNTGATACEWVDIGHVSYDSTSPLVLTDTTFSLKDLTGFGSAGQVIKTNTEADGLIWGTVSDTTYTASLPLVLTDTTFSLKNLSGFGTDGYFLQTNGTDTCSWAVPENDTYTASLPISISVSNVISTAFTASSTTTMTNKTISDKLYGKTNGNEQYIDFDSVYGIIVAGKSYEAKSYNIALKNFQQSSSSIYPFIGANDGDLFFHINSVGDVCNFLTNGNVVFSSGDLYGTTASKTPFTKSRIQDIYARSFLGESIVLSNGTTSSGYMLLYEDETNGSNYMKIQAPATLAESLSVISFPEGIGTLALTTDIPDLTTAVNFGTAAAGAVAVGKITQNLTLNGATIVCEKGLKIENADVGGAFLDMFEDSDEGTNYVRLKAPDAITASFTLQIPAKNEDVTIATTDDVPDLTTAYNFGSSTINNVTLGRFNNVKSTTIQGDPITFTQNGSSFSFPIVGGTIATTGVIPVLTTSANFGTGATGTGVSLGNVSNTTTINSTTCSIIGTTTITGGGLILSGGATAAGTISFAEDTDGGANKILLKPHTETFADFTITLPTTAGQLALTADIHTNYWELSTLKLTPIDDTYNVIIGQKANANANSVELLVYGSAEIKDKLRSSSSSEIYLDSDTTYGFKCFGKYYAPTTTSYNMSFENTETTSVYPFIGVKNDGAMVFHINNVGDVIKLTIDQDVNITAGDIIGDTPSVTAFGKDRIKDIYCRYLYGEALALSNGVTSSGYFLIYEDETNGNYYTKLEGADTLASNITLTLPKITGTLLSTAPNQTLDYPLFTKTTGDNPIFAMRDYNLSNWIYCKVPDIGVDIEITYPNATGTLALFETYPTNISADLPIVYTSGTGKISTNFTSSSTTDLTNKTITDLLLVEPTTAISFYIAKLLAASMNNGTTAEMVLGVANVARNCATIAFAYTSAGHADNALYIGLKGVEQALVIDGEGFSTFLKSITCDEKAIITGDIIGTTAGNFDENRCGNVFCDNIYASYVSIKHATEAGYISFYEKPAGENLMYLQAPDVLASDITVRLPSTACVIAGDTTTTTFSNKDFSDLTTFTLGVHIPDDQSIKFGSDPYAYLGAYDGTSDLIASANFSVAGAVFDTGSNRFKVTYDTLYTYIWNPSSSTGSPGTSIGGAYMTWHDNGSAFYSNLVYPSSGSYFRWYFAGVVKQEHNQNGSVYATGDFIATHVFSDDRLKTGEKALTNCMDTLNKLKPVIYDKYKLSALGGDTDDVVENIFTPFTERLGEKRLNSGFIAQEVYMIEELRHIVLPPEDSDMEKIKDTVIYDGDTLDEPEGFYEAQGWGTKQPACLFQEQLIPYLVGAIQDMDKRLKEQQIIIDRLMDITNF